MDFQEMMVKEEEEKKRPHSQTNYSYIEEDRDSSNRGNIIDKSIYQHR